jgi:hypothetical protein
LQYLDDSSKKATLIKITLMIKKTSQWNWGRKITKFTWMSLHQSSNFYHETNKNPAGSTIQKPRIKIIIFHKLNSFRRSEAEILSYRRRYGMLHIYLFYCCCFPLNCWHL